MERWKRKDKELIVFTKAMVSNPVFLHPKGPTKDAIYTQHSQEVINKIIMIKKVPTEIIKYNVIYSCSVTRNEVVVCNGRREGARAYLGLKCIACRFGTTHKHTL